MIDTNESAEPEEESVFPADCHFKIICHNEEGVGDRVKAALKGLGVTETVEAGNQSSGGRYITYNVSVYVTQRERMEEIDAALRRVDGVRMIL